MIQKDAGPLKVVCGLVRIIAWVFFTFGIIHGLGIIFSVSQEVPKFFGLVTIILYGFGFLIVYLITLMAELLFEMWQFLKKERI